jgi:putative ABC transport system ATP-binding protein
MPPAFSSIAQAMLTLTAPAPQLSSPRTPENTVHGTHVGWAQARHPLLELRGVDKAQGAGAACALRGIDLRVDEGEFIALTGPAGAGKSALLNLLAGLEPADSGSYRFRGVHVDTLSAANLTLLRRFFLGHVPARLNMRLAANVRDYVEAPLVHRSESAVTRRAAAGAALEQAGLAGWEDSRMTQLSTVQMRKVAIARALITRPALLLVDADAGQAGGAEIMEVLAEINYREGISIIAVTGEGHGPAGRVLRLREGCLEYELREPRDHAVRTGLLA